jgi:hypothetical protein
MKNTITVSASGHKWLPQANANANANVRTRSFGVFSQAVTSGFRKRSDRERERSNAFVRSVLTSGHKWLPQANANANANANVRTCSFGVFSQAVTSGFRKRTRTRTRTFERVRSECSHKRSQVASASERERERERERSNVFVRSVQRVINK